MVIYNYSTVVIERLKIDGWFESTKLAYSWREPRRVAGTNHGECLGYLHSTVTTGCSSKLLVGLGLPFLRYTNFSCSSDSMEGTTCPVSPLRLDVLLSEAGARCPPCHGFEKKMAALGESQALTWLVLLHPFALRHVPFTVVETICSQHLLWITYIGICPPILSAR